MGAKKWPPIAVGTVVKTTKPDLRKRKDWTDEAWKARKWDSYGLFAITPTPMGFATKFCTLTKHVRGMIPWNL